MSAESRITQVKRGAANIPNDQIPDISGKELYRRFLAGDTDAFEELVRLYEQELSLFINGIIHDYYEAKHLVIETFAQLAVSGSFDGKSTLKTYLFTIGKNLAARYMKLRGRESHLPFEDVIEKLLGGGETPETFMEREENKALLNAAMRDLKEDYRMVLQLLYFQDMSYKEAGQVLGKTVKQTGDLAYRAKASLKKKLESGGYSHV